MSKHHRRSRCDSFLKGSCSSLSGQDPEASFFGVIAAKAGIHKKIVCEEWRRIDSPHGSSDLHGNDRGEECHCCESRNPCENCGQRARQKGRHVIASERSERGNLSFLPWVPSLTLASKLSFWHNGIFGQACKPRRTLSPLGRNGFTLVELLLVVTILVVMVGMSVPIFWRTYDTIRLDDISRNIAKLTKYAREKARIERTTCTIHFNLDGRKYYLKVDEASRVEGGEMYREGRIEGRTYPIPEGISIELSGEEITFHPNGSSEETTLKLKNGDETVTLIVDRGGHVRICEE